MAFHEKAFLDYIEHERRFSPHTILAYTQDLSQFINFCQEKQCLTAVEEVRHLHVRSWIVEQMEHKIVAIASTEGFLV